MPSKRHFMTHAGPCACCDGARVAAFEAAMNRQPGGLIGRPAAQRLILESAGPGARLRFPECSNPFEAVARNAPRR